MTNKGITKQSLDQLMVEYNYEKNSIENTLYFLSFMWEQYEKLNKEQHNEQGQHSKNLQRNRTHSRPNRENEKD